MGYRGEGTNPLGFSSFFDLFDDTDWEEVRSVAKLAEDLKSSLGPKERKLLPTYRSQRKLISVSVDGGSQVLFPFIRELSVGLIRVSAASDDMTEALDPLVLPIKNYELFPVRKDDEGKKSQNKANLKGFFIKLFAENKTLKEFSAATGITPVDIGDYAAKDHQALTGVVRDLLEWAYIVGVVMRFQGIKVLIVRDGRLEQHGMPGTFLSKLKAFFEAKHAYVVGVVKGTKLLREGVPIWVIADWVGESEGRFYFKVPRELMEYVYGFEKQWDPAFDHSYVFGNRYVTKLFDQSFNPLESVITFDVPDYIVKDQEVEDIVATLHACRSVLFGGTLGIVSEAHQLASVSSGITRQLEDTFESKSGVKLPFRRWGLVE